MWFWRLLGGLFLAFALAAVGIDVWHWTHAADKRLSTVGELWFALAPGGLNLTQAVVQRYLLPEIWDWIGRPLLLAPAAIVAGMPALLFLWLGFRRRREKLARIFGKRR